MADVLYQGKHIGCLNFDAIREGKFVFTGFGLDSLVTLFSIKPNEEIELTSVGKIQYSTFREEYLSKVSGFYPFIEMVVIHGGELKEMGKRKPTSLTR